MTRIGRFRELCRPFLREHGLDLLKGTAAGALVRLIGYVASFGVLITISRHHGAAGAGRYAMVLSILGITGLLCMVGTQRSIVRFIAVDRSSKAIGGGTGVWFRISIIVLFLSLAGGAILYGLAGWLDTTVFQKQHIDLSLRIISPALPFYCLYSINASALQGMKRIAAATALRSTIPQFLILAGLWTAWALGVRAIDTVFISLALASVITCALSYLIWKSLVLKDLPFESASTMSVRKILSVSGPMLISSAIFMVLAWGDTLVLGAFCSPEKIGIYRAALRLAMLIEFVLEAVRGIAGPKFADAYWHGDSAVLRLLMILTSRLVFWLTLPCILGLILLSKLFLTAFGPEFAAGQQALLILALGQTANSLCGPVGVFLQMTDGQKTVQHIVTVAAVVNIGLNLLLVPRWGINGAACATAVSTMFWNVSAGLCVRSRLGYWIGYVPGRGE